MNINLKDYLYLAEGQDMTLSAVTVVQNATDGDTVSLGGGELHFYPTYAFEKEYYISNNDFGVKPIVFPLIGKKNVTIDGEGAKLIFHGKVMPFVIDNCENITVKNLTVEYSEPMYFHGKILDAGDDYVEMEYDESMFHCDILEDSFRFYGDGWENITNKVLVNEFDGDFKGPVPVTDTYFAYLGKEKDNSFLAGFYRYLTATKPAENRLRLEGHFNIKHNVGKYWLCAHNSRDYPGIFGNESKNLVVENVTLNHTLAMGVICQICENITLKNVQAVPSEGRLLSVDADATHFVNCSGLVHIDGCRFESMMDDACNIHGMYVPVNKKLDDHTVMLNFRHHQQRAVNIFKAGDRIALTDNETLRRYGEFTVKSSKLLSKEFIVLETEEILPEILPKGHAFENFTRMPEVHIENTCCGYNRPRGFLLSTCKDALVENCTFYNINQAIDINGDANSWFESGPCGKLMVRNNRFDNAAYSGGAVIQALPQERVATDVPYSKSLIVENNYFRMHEPRFMFIRSFEKVVYKNNVFEQDEGLTPAWGISEDGFIIEGCKQVEVEK